MATLATCLKRLKDVVRSDDVDLIREVYADKKEDGLKAADAAVAAVDEVLESLQKERSVRSL